MMTTWTPVQEINIGLNNFMPRGKSFSVYKHGHVKQPSQYSEFQTALDSCSQIVGMSTCACLTT